MKLRKGDPVLVSGKVPAKVVRVDHRQVLVKLQDGRTSLVMLSSCRRAE